MCVDKYYVYIRVLMYKYCSLYICDWVWEKGSYHWNFSNKCLRINGCYAAILNRNLMKVGIHETKQSNSIHICYAYQIIYTYCLRWLHSICLYASFVWNIYIRPLFQTWSHNTTVCISLSTNLIYLHWYLVPSDFSLGQASKPYIIWQSHDIKVHYKVILHNGHMIVR